MSNYHVLSGTKDGSKYSVAYHIIVPNENNDVPDVAPNSPINLRTALKNDDAVDKTSQVVNITAGEQTQLTNGELYEHRESLGFHSGLSPAAAKARMDARYTELSASVANALRRMYRFAGYKSN